MNTRRLPAAEVTGVHIGYLVKFPVPGYGDEGAGDDVTGRLVAVTTWEPTNARLIELTVRDLDTGLDRPRLVNRGTWVELTPA